MPPKRHIMGLFNNEDKVVSAINELKQSSYEFIRVNTPIPSHKIMDALKLKNSRVGWFTLAGGITGFFTGFLLAAFTAARTCCSGGHGLYTACFCAADSAAGRAPRGGR